MRLSQNISQSSDKLNVLRSPYTQEKGENIAQPKWCLYHSLTPKTTPRSFHFENHIVTLLYAYINLNRISKNNKRKTTNLDRQARGRGRKSERGKKKFGKENISQRRQKIAQRWIEHRFDYMFKLWIKPLNIHLLYVDAPDRIVWYYNRNVLCSVCISFHIFFDVFFLLLRWCMQRSLCKVRPNQNAIRY